jgi:cytochrome b561
MTAHARVQTFSPAASGESAGNAGKGSSPPLRFDAVSMTLHWLTAALILAQLVGGWSMSLVQDDQTADRLLAVHRSVGVVTWFVVAARLIWRSKWAVKPPLPQDMPLAQKVAARAVEWSLYGLLLLQPLTGLGHSLARGKPFTLFWLQVPALMARDKPLSMMLHDAHAMTAKLMLAVIAMHVGAALFHGLIRRDGVLASMWLSRHPGRSALARRAGTQA